MGLVAVYRRCATGFAVDEHRPADFDGVAVTQFQLASAFAVDPGAIAGSKVHQAGDVAVDIDANMLATGGDVFQDKVILARSTNGVAARCQRQRQPGLGTTDAGNRTADAAVDADVVIFWGCHLGWSEVLPGRPLLGVLLH